MIKSPSRYGIRRSGGYFLFNTNVPAIATPDCWKSPSIVLAGAATAANGFTLN